MNSLFSRSIITKTELSERDYQDFVASEEPEESFLKDEDDSLSSTREVSHDTTTT